MYPHLVNGEVRGWPGAVCLLFSVLFLDLAESLMPCARLGVMGHYDGGMLDIYSDLTQLCSYFGGPIEMMEVDEPSRPPAGCLRSPSEYESFRRVSIFNPIARRRN